MLVREQERLRWSLKSISKTPGPRLDSKWVVRLKNGSIGMTSKGRLRWTTWTLPQPAPLKTFISISGVC
eukprot:3670768-Rhodomonas_salina.2